MTESSFNQSTLCMQSLILHKDIIYHRLIGWNGNKQCQCLLTKKGINDAVLCECFTIVYDHQTLLTQGPSQSTYAAFKDVGQLLQKLSF